MININNVKISSNISGTINVSGDIEHDTSKVILELIVWNKDSDIYIKFKRDNKNYSANILFDGWYTYYAIAVEESDLDSELNLKVTINGKDIILSSANDIIDYLDLEHGQNNSIDNARRDLFFINNLRNCTIQLEKTILDDMICNCVKPKCLEQQSSDRNIADFLLISVFLLENLIYDGKFEECQRILDSLNICENICKVQINKKCNCDDLRF